LGIPIDIKKKVDCLSWDARRYIEKEDNAKLLDFFLNVLSNMTEFVIQPSDIDDSDLTDYSFISDTATEAGKVRVCLQESDDFIMPGSANNVG